MQEEPEAAVEEEEIQSEIEEFYSARDEEPADADAEEAEEAEEEPEQEDEPAHEEVPEEAPVSEPVPEQEIESVRHDQNWARQPILVSIYFIITLALSASNHSFRRKKTSPSQV